MYCYIFCIYLFSFIYLSIETDATEEDAMMRIIGTTAKWMVERNLLRIGRQLRDHTDLMATLRDGFMSDGNATTERFNIYVVAIQDRISMMRQRIENSRHLSNPTVVPQLPNSEEIARLLAESLLDSASQSSDSESDSDCESDSGSDSSSPPAKRAPIANRNRTSKSPCKSKSIWMYVLSPPAGLDLWIKVRFIS